MGSVTKAIVQNHKKNLKNDDVHRINGFRSSKKGQNARNHTLLMCKMYEW